MFFKECEDILSDFGGRFLDLGVVIIGQHHNPSILTPDFLRYNNIVPEEYKLDEGSLMITKPAANLSYGKLSIQADMNRIALGETADNGGFIAPEVVRQYLKHVPHVQYTALGINPVVCADTTQNRGNEIILHRLIQNGPWLSYDDVVPAVESKFMFPLDGGKHILLEIAAGNVVAAPEVNNALIFKGNLHFGIPADSVSGNVARDILGDTEAHVRKYCELVSEFMKGMKSD